MVSAPLSPAVGRVHHPLWRRSAAFPDVMTAASAPALSGCVQQMLVERSINRAAVSHIVRRARRPHHGRGAWGPGRRRLGACRSRTTPRSPLRCREPRRPVALEVQLGQRGIGCTTPGRTIRRPAARWNGSIRPRRNGCGSQGWPKATRSAHGLDTGEDGATITSRDVGHPEMQRCLKTPANGVPRHHKVEPRGLEPQPLACKVAEWASSGVIRAWPAANSSVQYSQVALLLPHFAASGSLPLRR